MERPTHSQNWDRIGQLRPKLRSGVQVGRRHFRARRAYVVHDPAANQFFRLDPVSYHLVGLLDGRRTVEEAWVATNERFGDRATTQNETVGVLSQMYATNLIAVDGKVDADQMFRRMQRREHLKLKRQATGFLFIKLPMFDPAPVIDWLLPLVRPLLRKWMILVWATLVIAGALQIAMHFQRFVAGIWDVLRIENLLMLYAVFVVTKLMHEFSHGVMCRRFGGQVHEMGIMLLVFNPVPYCDATSSWGFANRWQRAAVGMAGIFVELGLAAAAAIVWANTASGEVQRIAYYVILISGVSSILVNANPLMRFDGYHVLCDLLDMPNLAQRANRHTRAVIQRRIFGMSNTRPVAATRSETGWLTAYFVAGWTYRVIIFSGIIWFVSQRFLGLGVILAGVALSMWLVVPVVKYAHWLATSAELLKHRVRASVVTMAVAVAVVVGVGLVPVDGHARATGVVMPPHAPRLTVGASGFIEQVLVDDGQRVRAGDAILVAVNPHLDVQRQTLAREYEETAIRRREALQDKHSRDAAALAANLAHRLDVLEQRMADVDARIEALTLRAPIDGTIIAPQLEGAVGRFVERGDVLGLVRGDAELHVRFVLRQTQSAWLHDGSLRDRQVQMRTAGRPDRVIDGEVTYRSEAATRRLPHGSLSVVAGGPILTDPQDPDLLRADESVFEVHVAVRDAPALLAGQRVTGRFTLKREPLAAQWARRIAQLMQTHGGA